ncbi:unnamed protein product, partial [marine sediment metagenome]
AWKLKAETLEQVYQVFPNLKEREGQLARTLSGGEHKDGAQSYDPKIWGKEGYKSQCD